LTPSGYDYYNHTYTGGVWVPNPVIHYNASGATVGNLRTVLDNVNSSFRKRVARGEVILSDFQLSDETLENGITSFTLGPYYHSDPTKWPHGYKETVSIIAQSMIDNVCPPLLDLSMDGPGMEALALQKAYARMNESAFMSGVAVSELSETVGMLRRPLGGAQDLLKRMLKNRSRFIGKTAMSVIRATKNTWLEYRYGWKPLLMDAESIATLAKKKREACVRRRLVVRAAEGHQISDEQSFSQQPLSWNSSWRLSGAVRHSSEFRANAGVIFDVKSRTAYQELAADSGIRARDLPATIWEMIPYSFVVDWFVGVGTWLQAITPVPDIEVRGNWVTTVWRYHKEADSGTVHVALSVPDPITENRSYTGYSRHLEQVVRKCNQPLQLTPVLKAKPLSVLHSVDALALSTDKVLRALKVFKH
jgi:hypothetical protein